MFTTGMFGKNGAFIQAKKRVATIKLLAVDYCYFGVCFGVLGLVRTDDTVIDGSTKCKDVLA